jgi:predicted outer membrane repeat protein
VNVFSQAGAIAIQTEDPTVVLIRNSLFAFNYVTTPVLSASEESAFLDSTRIPWGLNVRDGRGAGGAIHVREAKETLDFAIHNCSFLNNSATGDGGALSVVGWPGGGRVLLLNLSASTFSGNSAANGGAVSLFSRGITATIDGCSFNNNGAAQSGGALALLGDASSTRISRTSMSGNSASYAGGCVTMSGTHALSVADSSMSGNSAFGGSLMFLQGDPISPVTLASLNISGNSAQAGALFFTTAPVDVPACAACSITDNSAALYGAHYASMPVTHRLTAAGVQSAAAIAVQSAKPLPRLNVTLYDAYDQVVEEWPRLLVGITTRAGGLGLSGATTQYYSAGAAAFSALTIVDVVNASYEVGYRLSSPLLGDLDGATGAFEATVSPCLANEQFDDATSRCVCQPGAFADAGVCTPCAPGSFAASPAARVCTPCAPNTYAAGDGINCLACPAFSTSLRGAAHISGCKCAPGYEQQPSTYTCSICQPGSFFDGAASRCSRCAAGFASSQPAAGQCDVCGFDTFSLEGAAYCSACPPNSLDARRNTECRCSPGYFDALFGRNGTSPECVKCPLGGSCTDGSLLAAEGYWREQPADTVFFKCREGKCLAEQPPSGARRRRALLSSSSTDDAVVALNTSGNCVAGSTGPLCSLCFPGYAVQGGACAPCDASASWEAWSPGDKAALLALALAFALIFVAFAFFTPLSPTLERISNFVTDGLERMTLAAQAYARACMRAMLPEKKKSDAEKLRAGQVSQLLRPSKRMRITQTLRAAETSKRIQAVASRRLQLVPLDDAQLAAADAEPAAASEPVAPTEFINAPAQHHDAAEEQSVPPAASAAEQAATRRLLLTSAEVVVVGLLAMENIVPDANDEEEEEDGHLFHAKELEDLLRYLARVAKIIVKCAARAPPCDAASTDVVC